MPRSDRDPLHPEAPLDQCLENARWPEATGLQRNRVEAHWDRLARDRARTRRRWARWILAASIFSAFAAGIGGWLLWNKERPGQIPPDPGSIASPRTDEEPVPGEKPVDRPDRRPRESMVRNPTRYERAVFGVVVKRLKRARANRETEPLARALNHALEQLDADIKPLCQPLLPRREAYEELILTRLGSWELAEQKAALKVLEEIGSPRSIPVLERLSRDSEFAELAWPVALSLAPPRQLGHWARTTSPVRREEAVQTLIRRRSDPKAIGEFLRLIAQPTSRTLALEVAANEPNPPVEALFLFLNRGEKEHRHSAGLVLGTIADDAITEKLLALARERGFPPEVMIALLNSPDERAARFLDQAKRHPAARSAVQLAYLEWELISYTSTFPEPLENRK